MRRPASRPRRKLFAAQLLETRMPLDGGAAGAISGTIWLDDNQNGIRDPDEPGVPDVIVYLDENVNGVRDEHEPFVVTQSDNPLILDFDEAGTFHFENLPDGDYTLAVELPDHAQWVTPSPELIVHDVIENGSFEDYSPTERLSGWQDSSTDSLLRWQRAEEGNMGLPHWGAHIEPTSPQDGDWVAAHKFNASLEPTTYTLQQQVSLGPGDEAEFRFMSRIQWNHQLSQFPDGVFEEPHTFTVFILDPDSETPLAEFHLLETDIRPGYREGDTGWLLHTMDLSAFLNQEIIVQFHCYAPTWGPVAGAGQFELDAIQLLVSSTPPIPLGQQVSIAEGVSVGEIDFGIYSSLDFNPSPSIDAPVSALLSEDIPLDFDAAAGLGIQLQAVPGSENLLRLELSVDVGTLQLSSLEDIVLLAGTGVGDSHLILEGTLESLQMAIDGLRYTPPENYHGNSMISLNLDDQNDDAFQGRQSVGHTISLDVTSVNDLPFVAQPIEPLQVSRGTETISLDLSQLFDDVDIDTSGDQLTLSITQNSEAQWITSQLEFDHLQLHFDAAFHGTAEIEITAADLGGELATFVLFVSVREKFDLEMTLVSPESSDQLGSLVTEIPRSPYRLHEWEPMTAQLWFTPPNADSQGTLQISVDFNPQFWTPGEILTVEGATIETMLHSDENGTWLELTISQWESAAIAMDESILLGTLTMVPAVESPVGVPMSDLTAHPAASNEVGIGLREARFAEPSSSLTATTAEGSELLPVVFDLDDDGRIGLADFTRFISSYGQFSTPDNPAALAADFTQSGRVGLSDFVLFIQNYGRRKEEHPNIIFPEILRLDSGSEPDPESPEGSEILEGEPIVESPMATQSHDGWPFWGVDSATSAGVMEEDVRVELRGDDLNFPESETPQQSAIQITVLDQFWASLASGDDPQGPESLTDETTTAWSSELSLPSEFREEETDRERC